jgi:hypothetical protein
MMGERAFRDCPLNKTFNPDVEWAIDVERRCPHYIEDPCSADPYLLPTLPDGACFTINGQSAMCALSGRHWAWVVQ